METPLVSVLVTVYNGIPLIKEVVEHLVNQTYRNIEIVIVNDASEDETLNYLSSVSDERLKVLSNGKLGRGKALNFGLTQCTGKYVAINDADDFSNPERLSKQVEFLESNPDYGLVGSNFIKRFSSEKQERSDKSLDNGSLRIELSKHSCIQHSCVMFRKSVMDAIGGYNLNLQFLFDRDIYIRVAEVSKIANLPEHLVIINRTENQFFINTFKGFKRQWFTLKQSYNAIKRLQLPKYLYVKRTFVFIYSAILNFIKWKK